MAFSSKMVKNWYKNLSIEELEQKYEELKSNFYFKSKEDQIRFLLRNYLNVSHNANINAYREGIEELLKEKTGNVYNIKEKTYNITLADLISFISNENNLTNDILINFFNSIENIEENEKSEFLTCLYQNKQNFDMFINEIQQINNKNDLYKKYFEIAKKYYLSNIKKS